MFPYKYIYSVSQKSATTGLSSTVSSVEKTKETQKPTTEKTKRQAIRAEKDKKAAKTSPKQAQKLKILSTKIPELGNKTVEQILRENNPKELVQLPDAIVQKLPRRNRDRVTDLKSIKKKKEQKKQEEQQKKQEEQQKKQEEQKTAKLKAEKAETKTEKLSEQQKSEEDKAEKVKTQQTDAEKATEETKNTLEQERREKILSSLIGKSKKYMKAGASEKVAQYARSIQKSPNTPIFKSLVKQGYKKEDIQSGKYNATIQAHIITTKPSEFAPSDPAKLRAYNRTVEQMGKILHIRPATKPNTAKIVQSVVLGSDRERVTNQAMAVVESGKYSTVQYDEGSEEIVFESKSGNGRYIIDTGVVPAVSRFERDGIQIEQPAKEPSPEDEKRADLTDEVYELETEAIKQKGKINTLDTSNIAVQKALGRADADSPSPLKRVGNMYEEAQQKFLKESGDNNKPKPTKQKIQEAENLLQLGSDLANAEKQDVASKIVDNINASMYGAQNDLPLENSLGKQKLSLRQHIDTLKKLDAKEQDLQKYSKSAEQAQKEQEKFAENVDDTFDFFGQISVNKLPQETIDTLLKNANILAVSEDSKFRIGEEKLTSGQKQLFMTYVSRVLQGVNGVSEGEVGKSREEHYAYIQQVLKGKDISPEMRKKLIDATVGNQSDSGSLLSLMRGEGLSERESGSVK